LCDRQRDAVIDHEWRRYAVRFWSSSSQRGGGHEWIIGFITRVDSTLYFAQHTNGTEGDRLNFSFTVLTTTGFGDFSVATRLATPSR
jgi:hypothetical protein